jgi:mannose-6-phosphate isomerase-like protein (cupin superfamily)
MSDVQRTAPRFIANTVQEALITDSGPQPRILWEDPKLKLIIGGLQPGQQIPAHPEAFAVYHFLAGSGVMNVDDVPFAVDAGCTLIVPQGASRGLQAQSRLVFLATRIA